MTLKQAITNLKAKVNTPEGVGTLMGIDLTYDLPLIVLISGKVKFFKFKDVY